MFASPCRDCRSPLCERLCAWLKANRKTVRWAVFLLLVSAFFTWLGSITEPVYGAGFCRVFY